MENQLYDYWPMIHRPKLELPNGARVAVWIGLNVEHFELDKPSTTLFQPTAGLVPDPLNYGWRDYGVRVGIWRLMELFDRLGVRASVMLNSDVCLHYPEIIVEGNKRSWVWVAHGKNNSIYQAGMDLETERAYLTDVVVTIRQHTGRQPQGWLGPALTETLNTPALLAELGLSYVCDWTSDDQPFPLNVPTGRMISVPYALEVGDIIAFIQKGQSGEEFYQTLIDQFDQLYDEGAESARIMSMAIHPFLIGAPFQLRYLRRALEYMLQHDRVWFTTSDEIARWYFDRYYDEAVATIRRRRP